MKLIACRVMIDEMRKFLPAGVDAQVFEISRHVRPKQLKVDLQAAIDRADGSCDTILLGYGLCSNAVIGLRAKNTQMVMPRMHDCIGVFLGSHRVYMEEMEREPAFFLTHGYIRGYRSDGGGPMDEFDRVKRRFGARKADEIVGAIMRPYRRLVYLKAEMPLDLEADRTYAREMASKFHMRYEERLGTSELLRRLVQCDWDDKNFVVVEPGEEITLEHFWNHQQS